MIDTTGDVVSINDGHVSMLSMDKLFDFNSSSDQQTTDGKSFIDKNSSCGMSPFSKALRYIVSIVAVFHSITGMFCDDI